MKANPAFAKNKTVRNLQPQPEILPAMTPPPFQLKTSDSEVKEETGGEMAQFKPIGKESAPPPFSPGPPPAEKGNGLPVQLKSGLETLGGVDLSDVKVHRNSKEPAQFQAHAFAQGNNIHLGPGQEKHLPHEGWHMVQQKQGRVQPTRQLKSKGINDDPGLEKEADEMGAKALQTDLNAPKQAMTRQSQGQKPAFQFARGVFQFRKTQADKVFEAITANHGATDQIPKADVIKTIETHAKLDEGQAINAIRSLRDKAKPKLYPVYDAKLNFKALTNLSLDSTYTETPGGDKEEADTTLIDKLLEIAKAKGISDSSKIVTVQKTLSKVIKSDPQDTTWKKYREELIDIFKNKDKAVRYLTTDFVRHGGEHEQILTSITAKKVLQDLENPDHLPKNTKDEVQSIIDIQSDTNAPTHYIVLKSITKKNNKILQNHHPTSKKMISYVDEVDPKKLHNNPGSGKGSSPEYHGQLSGVAEDEMDYTVMMDKISDINENELADENDIVKHKAEDRARQKFRTTSGKDLWFDDSNDLERIAVNIQIRKEKVMGLIEHTRENLGLKKKTIPILDMGADSDVEMQDRLNQKKPAKRKVSTGQGTKKRKVDTN